MNNPKNEQFLVAKSVKNQVLGKTCNQRSPDVKKLLCLEVAHAAALGVFAILRKVAATAFSQRSAN
jgi:hypothetical protein